MPCHCATTAASPGWVHITSKACRLQIVSRCTQIYAIYDYQVAFNVRLATENPYVPTFGSDIPGGPPGLGVSPCSSDEVQR